jgi:hypothetical protein
VATWRLEEEENKLTRKKEKGIFWVDGSVLYLHFDRVLTIVSTVKDVQ